MLLRNSFRVGSSFEIVVAAILDCEPLFVELQLQVVASAQFLKCHLERRLFEFDGSPLNKTPVWCRLRPALIRHHANRQGTDDNHTASQQGACRRGHESNPHRPKRYIRILSGLERDRVLFNRNLFRIELRDARQSPWQCGRSDRTGNSPGELRRARGGGLSTGAWRQLVCTDELGDGCRALGPGDCFTLSFLSISSWPCPAFGLASFVQFYPACL